MLIYFLSGWHGQEAIIVASLLQYVQLEDTPYILLPILKHAISFISSFALTNRSYEQNET